MCLRLARVALNASGMQLSIHKINIHLVWDHARAVASYNTAANACILALNGTASKAALFSGNSNLTLSGCSVMTNSTAADAGTVQGTAALTTTLLEAVPLKLPLLKIRLMVSATL